MLREDVEQDADQKKNCELDQDDHAAGEESAAAVFFVAGGEEPLHDGLVSAVAGHGQEGAADQTGPERVFGGEVEGEIENLKFVAGGCGDLCDFVPAAGNSVEEEPESCGAAGEIEEELGDVGPDDGGHAAFESVENGESDDDDDGEVLRSSENDADDQGDGGDAHAFGDGTRDEEGAGGDGAHFFAETLFDDSVSGEKLATEVAGEEQEDDQDSADEIADDELNEGEVRGVGDGGRADDGERGGFRGDNGERERPPGGGAAAEKIVETDGFAGALRDGFFGAAEAHAERGYGEEVGDDDSEVNRVDAH